LKIKQRGFTAVEFLVVASLLGLIGAVSFSILQYSVRRAQFSVIFGEVDTRHIDINELTEEQKVLLQPAVDRRMRGLALDLDAAENRKRDFLGGVADSNMDLNERLAKLEDLNQEIILVRAEFYKVRDYVRMFNFKIYDHPSDYLK